MTIELVHNLLILLSAGLVAGIVCRHWNISVLIGYLLAGACVGQGMLGLVHDHDHQLAHLAEVGVFLLLFTIGLEFSVDDLKRLGLNFVVGGATQMGLVAVPVWGVLNWAGMSWQSSALIACCVAFSSTVLVFRSLTELGHSQQSHGRRAIGILLFQDAALVPLLLMVPLLTGQGDVPVWDFLLLGIISSAFIVAVVLLRYALAEWIIPLFARYRSSELIVLFTLLVLGGVTLAAHSVGLPPAVGAFAAGLIFNGNRWSHQIDAYVLPFREAFAAVFFVGLGLIFDPMLLWTNPELLLLLPALIVLKMAAATIALFLTGLKLKTSVGMGIGLAHVGEFAFVLALLGFDREVISLEVYQSVVILAVGSLMLTPNLIKLGLRLVQTESDDAGEQSPLANSYNEKQSVIIGAGPIGQRISSHLETSGHVVNMVDLSPLNLHAFAQLGFHTVAGDATQWSVLQEAHVPEAELIIVCVPDDLIANRVVSSIRKLNPECRVIVRCRYQANVKKILKSGANEIVAEESEAALALLKRIAN